MSDPKPRCHTGLKFAGVVVGVLVVLLVAFFLWVRSVADRRWAAMERRVSELLLEVKARDASRPPLRGEALPGNAWDDYAAAIKAVAGLKGSHSVLGDFISRGPKADRAKVEALVAANASALDSLRRGVRRSSAQYPYEWEKGASMDVPGLLHSQVLANLAASQARFLAEAGKARESAELLLDTCRFGSDLGHNGVLISEMIGIAFIGIALDELRELLLSRKLTREELSQVARELGELDRAFPRNGPVMVNEALTMGCTFLKLGTPEFMGVWPQGSDSVTPSLLAWRYAFSGRIMMADAFETTLRQMRRCEEGEGKSWSEARKLSAELDAEAQASKNAIVKIAGPGLLAWERGVRAKRAQLRLLRAAAQYLANGQVLELEDPFGDKLLHAESPGAFKVWSVGRNGVDDGGLLGGWKPDSTDIVLEVPR